jgi:N-methylhydantoinase B
MLELGAELGWETLHEHAGQWLRYSERRMRSALARLPAGEAVVETRHDPVPGAPDGVPLRIGVRVDPAAARVTVDLRENPDCLPNGLNLTESTARSAAMLGVFNSLHADVPPNAGSFRCIEVLLRENCVAGIPRHPASCSAATTNILDRVSNAVQAGMAQLGEGIGMAAFGYPFPPSCAVISGHDPRYGGAPFVNQIFLGLTCGGASPVADGWLTAGGVADGAVLQRDSVEIDEVKHPILVLSQRLEPDTEGAGRTIGAPAARVEFTPLGCDIRVVYSSDGSVSPAAGVRGGQSGAPACQQLRTAHGQLRTLDPFADITVRAGETVVSVCGGGGGYGDPLHRDPWAVHADVLERRVTRERAHDTYGVVVDEALTLDLQATDRYRDTLQGETT